MKPHLKVVAAVILLGAACWSIGTSLRSAPTVTLTVVTNGAPGSSTNVVFRVVNQDSRAILLTDLVVETATTAGWREAGRTKPSDPQRLATGATKDMTIPAPGDDQPWRLRAIYGRDVAGPWLWLAMLESAASNGRWPPASFGIMAGRYSCFGEVTAR
ncbi:MAG: hypothetical protein WCP53_09605 [Verrucomicrobiota bacterium]